MRYGMMVLAGWWLAVAALAQGLSITHDAVPFAVRGQPLTLKAKVTGAEEAESVTLYYALFRDAAPFRVPMKVHRVGLLCGHHRSPAWWPGWTAFSYYLEAQDKSGAITETPWYEVPLRKAETKAEAPAAGLPMPRPAGPAAPAPDHSLCPRTNPPRIHRTAVGKHPPSSQVVLPSCWGARTRFPKATAAGGGSDDGDDDGEVPVDPQGTYNGSVTTCLTTTGGVTTCESGSMSMVIGANKVVFSETIKPGEQLTNGLDGSSFTLVSSTSELGVNRTINL
jgi:hypothetical protein